jgi:hypothetical protein
MAFPLWFDRDEYDGWANDVDERAEDDEDEAEECRDGLNHEVVPMVAAAVWRPVRRVPAKRAAGYEWFPRGT